MTALPSGCPPNKAMKLTGHSSGEVWYHPGGDLGCRLAGGRRPAAYRRSVRRRLVRLAVIRFLQIATLSVAAAGASIQPASAVVCRGLQDEFDDPGLIVSLHRENSRLRLLLAEIQVVEDVISEMDEASFAAVFGQPRDKPPAQFSLPSFHGRIYCVGGLEYEREEPTQFFLIDDFAGVELHTISYGGDFLRRLPIIYFRTNSQFTPLRNHDDLQPRIDWDTKRLEELKAWRRSRKIEVEADVEAMVTLLPTTEGGREGEVRSGYRPMHEVHPGSLMAGVHRFLGRKSVAPGMTVPAKIKFVSPESFPHSLWHGKVVDIREDDQVVGHAEVVHIFNPMLLGPAPD